MKIRKFLDAHTIDHEHLSKEVVTIPDQSLSVRDILNNFTRGSLSIPPVDTSEDDDILLDDSFDDLVDAFDCMESGSSLVDELRNAPEETPEETPEPESSPTSEPSGE